MRLSKLALPLAVIGLLLSWPSAFPAIRIAVREYSPLEVTAFRLSVAALLMFSIGAFKGMGRPRRIHFLPIMVCGIVGLMVYNLGLGYGMLTISASAAGFIIALGPVFIVIFSALFLHEVVGWKTRAGIALSFVGATLIAVGKAGGFSLEWGAFYVLLSALSAAVMTLTQKPLLSHYTAYDLTAYMTLCAALSVLPLGWTVFPKVYLAFHQSVMATSSVWAMLHLAVSVSFIGYLLWGYVLSQLPASRVASLMYLIPISATLIAWGWIGEVPSVTTLIGGGIVIAGVAIVNIRRMQKKQPVEVMAVE
ncbi:MAG: DMT family transporter [Rickettsiales bacterium]|nr:DMT family transporter [Rickettsiales bacterium]